MSGISQIKNKLPTIQEQAAEPVQTTPAPQTVDTFERGLPARKSAGKKMASMMMSQGAMKTAPRSTMGSTQQGGMKIKGFGVEASLDRKPTLMDAFIITVVGATGVGLAAVAANAAHSDGDSTPAPST